MLVYREGRGEEEGGRETSTSGKVRCFSAIIGVFRPSGGGEKERERGGGGGRGRGERKSELKSCYIVALSLAIGACTLYSPENKFMHRYFYLVYKPLPSMLQKVHCQQK